MILSEVLSQYNDKDFVSIIAERPFDRFARTTSAIAGTCCVFVATSEYVKTIPSNASMVITTDEIAKGLDAERYGICISRDPKGTYFRAFCYTSDIQKGDRVKSTISESACIGKTALIAEYNVNIGDNVLIEDNVIIYKNVVIGNNCIIRAGAVLGIQDYNYFQDGDLNVHLPHYGQIILSDNVEVGNYSLIGQALYPGDKTFISENVKIGFHSVIGHDAQIGKNSMIYDRVIVGGYTEVGEGVRIALSATIKNGIRIGNRAKIDMGSVVIRSVSDDETVFGNPARRVITPNRK